MGVLGRKGRNTPSTIDQLPNELQELIGELRRRGATIDAILAKLHEMPEAAHISRSALGRHVKGLAETLEQIAHSRTVAEALVSRFGEEPDSKVARANVEIMHSLVMNTLTAVKTDEAGNPMPFILAPEEAMFLASAIQKLASAEKTNDDRIVKAQEAALKAAANRAVTAAKSKGLSKETVDLIRYAVTGTGA